MAQGTLGTAGLRHVGYGLEEGHSGQGGGIIVSLRAQLVYTAVAPFLHTMSLSLSLSAVGRVQRHLLMTHQWLKSTL